MNKRGGTADLFIFMILSFIILIMCAVFIYISGKAYAEVRTATSDMPDIAGAKNITQIVDSTLGQVDSTYQALYWISLMLIFGMVISIFIGSYLVTTKPIFFIPYIFIVIIAVIVAVAISNAYEQIIQTEILANIFAGFIGANFIMLKLPTWITAIGFIGAIIMFVRMGSKEGDIYGGIR